MKKSEELRRISAAAIKQQKETAEAKLKLLDEMLAEYGEHFVTVAVVAAWEEIERSASAAAAEGYRESVLTKTDGLSPVAWSAWSLPDSAAREAVNAIVDSGGLALPEGCCKYDVWKRIYASYEKSLLALLEQEGFTVHQKMYRDCNGEERYRFNVGSVSW